MRKYFVPFFIPLVLTWLLSSAGQGGVTRHLLAPGVELVQEVVPAPDGPLTINVLRVELKRSGVKVESGLARDVMLTDEPANGREPVGALAIRRGALAAVNGDFFPFTGIPLGLAIRDGELLREGMPHRAALGITPTGKVLVDNLLAVGSLFANADASASLDGINRPAAKNELILVTPSYGKSIRAKAEQLVIPLFGVELPVTAGRELSATTQPPVPGLPERGIARGEDVLVADGAAAVWAREHLSAGTSIRFRFDLISNPLPPGPLRSDLPSRSGSLRGRNMKSVWTDVAQAVGGGPWLVRDGKIAVDGEQEGFSATSFVNQRHPRTAAGVSADNTLILATVDGRQAFSRGATLSEMAALMLRLGAIQAINLDGGGSTTMVVNGAYINSPSDGEPRPVANALLVYAETAAKQTEITGEPVRLRAGERGTLSLGTAMTGGAPKVLWGTAEGRAYVDPNGSLLSNRAGSGTVIAVTSDQRFTVPYTIEPGPPARVRVSLGPAPNNPPDRSLITIVVTDHFGNAIPGQPVRISVAGGEVERTEANTGGGGRITLEIVWDTEAKGEAIISSGSLPAATVVRKAAK